MPSSLNWLLKRRARLLGLKQQIEKKVPDRVATLRAELIQAHEAVSYLNHMLRKAEIDLSIRLNDVIADLAAIDRTIRQYDPDINPEEIKPVYGHESPRVLGHGQFTRYILNSFRLSDTTVLSTTDIAIHVLVQSELILAAQEFPDFRNRVRCRLKTMVTLGKVIRISKGQRNLEGFWRLAIYAEPFTKQVQTT